MPLSKSTECVCGENQWFFLGDRDCDWGWLYCGQCEAKLPWKKREGGGYIFGKIFTHDDLGRRLGPRQVRCPDCGLIRDFWDDEKHQLWEEKFIREHGVDVGGIKQIVKQQEGLWEAKLKLREVKNWIRKRCPSK